MARRMRWPSPPESVAVALSSDRYSRPTSMRNSTLSCSSLSMSEAMAISLEDSLPGRERSHSSRSVISMAATWSIDLPSILNSLAFSFRRVPPQTGHTTFSSMSSTIPPKFTISMSWPSPMRKKSSEPKTIWLRASSGTSEIGSNMENPYFLAIARITSYFLLSRTFPSGTMPPSAMLRLLSGTMLSMFTSTIIPRPLQCGQ